MKKLLYTLLTLALIFSACKKENIEGCTDSTMFNYNPFANTDNGTCETFIYGCTNQIAINYNTAANSNDGSCIGACIGCLHQGGIVFYLNVNGGGLIAAPSDPLTGDTVATWGCYTDTIVGANGMDIGTGQENTDDILEGCTTPLIAADICDNLTIGAYDDWFLPSKKELNEMYLNLYVQGLGGFVVNSGIGSTRYWSSTEYNSFSAWTQLFHDTSSDGFPNENSKSNLGYVRAIRAF